VFDELRRLGADLFMLFFGELDRRDERCFGAELRLGVDRFGGLVLIFLGRELALLLERFFGLVLLRDRVSRFTVGRVCTSSLGARSICER
jgi:hypothetical protein